METYNWIFRRVGHPKTSYILNKMLGESNKISIGRQSPDNNGIICEGKKISSTHCELEFIDEQWFVKDLKSRNGIFVNTTKIPSATPTKLKPGDILGIGAVHNWTNNDFIFELIKKHETPSQLQKKTTQLSVPSRIESPNNLNSVGATTRKTDDENRLEWALKLNDNKLAAQCIVLIEKMSRGTNGSIRMDLDCKADPSLEQRKTKKRKRAVRPLIFSDDDDDDDSDPVPKRPSSQHLSDQRPMVEIPIIEISSDSDVSEQSEMLVVSPKGKALKKPSHNQHKSRKVTLSPPGNDSASSSFQSIERSPDDGRNDKLPSILMSSSEDDVQAPLYQSEVSYQIPTGKNRLGNLAESVSSESSSSSEESNSSKNTSREKPRKTLNEVVESFRKKPKEKSAMLTNAKDLSVRGNKRFYTASSLPTPAERENDNRLKRNHGRIPKKSTLGLRDWIKKKQPEMVSYGTLTSQATDTGHVSNTQVPVYGAQKSSNAAPSIPAPTRSGPASTQAVKVKNTPKSRNAMFADEISSQGRSGDSTRPNPSAPPTRPSTHHIGANAQSSYPRTAASQIRQDNPSQRRRSYREWNEAFNPRR